ncbi:MAG: hypothetical protein AB7U23_13705 [Dehalococcoidia bacterium]
MTTDTNPATALRSAMRDLLKMFTETLGDEAGAAALKTAVERALSEVTGAARAGKGQPAKRRTKAAAKSAATPAAKPTTPKPGPAAKGAKKKRKKKAKAGPPSPGRIRQMEAMREYWRKKRAEAEAGKKPAGVEATA